MAEAFPPDWLVPERLNDVIWRLRALPISGEGKKHALYEWCKHAGVALTGDMVERVTGRPAGEV